MNRLPFGIIAFCALSTLAGHSAFRRRTPIDDLDRQSRDSTTVGALLASIALALGPATASAHEFWVEPTQFSLEPGGRIGVRLCVADGFEGWSLAREARRIEEFVAKGPAGDHPIVGLDGSDPAGVVRLAAAGGYIVTYRSNRALTVVPAADFDRYASEKGLEKIVAGRGQRRANRGSVREAYSRHSKALVRVGRAGTDVFDRATGLRLELVAESSLSWANGDTPRSFRLLHDGKPLSGALVTAFRPGTADGDLSAHTGPDGRAGFRLPAPGMWRIAAVHLVDAPRGVRADWESLWASLTFELSSRPSMTAVESRTARNAACRNRIAATTAQPRT